MLNTKLEAHRISKEFGAGRSSANRVLDNISLEIKATEFVSIVGASGCGKTTFLRILDGLIEPTSGDVLIDGVKVGKPDHHRGFVFQKDSLWPWRTTLANVMFGLEVKRVPRKEAVATAQRLIDLVGLKGF